MEVRHPAACLRRSWSCQAVMLVQAFGIFTIERLVATSKVLNVSSIDAGTHPLHVFTMCASTRCSSARTRRSSLR